MKLRNAIEPLLAGLLIPLLPLRWVIQLLLGGRAYSVWCGAPIITMAHNASVERLLGVRAVSLVTHTYYITQAFDIDVSKWVQRPLLRYAASWLALAGVFLFAKRIHTYFDGGILPALERFQFNRHELFIYRLARLEHFVWTYGADVRVRKITQIMGEPNCCSECDDIGKHCICATDAAEANMRQVMKGAVAAFTMGDMMEYVPGSTPGLFFWPIDLKDGWAQQEPIYPPRDSARPLRVVHAPNHRQFKGTRHIELAVAQLRSEKISIELVLVEKMSNEEALKVYQSADLVIDQVLIGFHGYFALEAMALGKPVMCFIRDRQRYLLNPDACPIIDVRLESLADTLRTWACADRETLHERGRASRRYIEENFSKDAFASRLSSAYRNLGIAA